jgi:large subunit ribosomal protein L9
MVVSRKAFGMKVFLLKDVKQVGIQGEMITVSDGFAQNFLLPRKLAVQITPENEPFYKNKIRQVEHRKEVIASETSALAEKIKGTTITLRKRAHDGGKLYSSISPADIVDALSGKGISVAKKQVEFEKAIKEVGKYEVLIKLSTRLQPRINVTVVAG